MASTSDPREGREAFALYEVARSKWNQRTPAAIREAIRLLEQAIAMDGTFALACAALADCYSILLDYGILSPREGLTAARLASGRALHRGPGMAESLTSAALVRQMDLDWPSAEAEFRAAIQAHPGYPVAHQRYALFLAWMGRGEEGATEVAVAQDLAPDSAAVAASAAWIEYYRRNWDEALLLAEKAVHRFPGFSSAAVVQALAMVRIGKAAQAIGVLEKAASREPDNASLASLLSYTHAKAGNGEEAAARWNALRPGVRRGYVSPYYLAVPQLGLGNRDAAMAELKRARAEGAPQLVYLAAEPIFDPIRDRPDFRSLLENLNLPFPVGPAESSVGRSDPQPLREVG